jgi:hypothetical protein
MLNILEKAQIRQKNHRFHESLAHFKYEIR